MSDLLIRWERIALGIRLAYNPQAVGAIRVYLGLGQKLVRQGLLADAPAQRRMLRLLLQTAADPLLPGYWRSVCLELSVRPLARLRHLLPAPQAAALEAEWERAWEQGWPEESPRHV